MELPRDGDYRYTLVTQQTSRGVSGYVLRMKQPAGDPRLPRVAVRYDLPEHYAYAGEAYRAAVAVAERMAAGELHAFVPEVKKRIQEYDLYASALFQLQSNRWEPALRIRSRKPQNKGAEQDFNSEQSPLLHNGFPSPERAREYAVEYGERLVLKAVPGLRV